MDTALVRRLTGGLFVVVVVACSSVPDDPLRSLATTSRIPQPDAGMAEESGVSLRNLERGYTVFLRKCHDCHEPRIPADPDHPDWHPVLTGMSWNAELPEGEKEDMIAYLRAAAE